MKRLHMAKLLLSACTLFALLPCISSADASTIRYSWSGFLLSEGDEDPWQLGETSHPFSLHVWVARDATDRSDGSIQHASYQASDVSFILDGQELEYQGGGILDFTDDLAEHSDMIVFGGIFERFGHSVEIGTAVVLPRDTFEFFSLSEPPPFSESTSNSFGPSSCCGSTYTSVVPDGTPVTVVPEPLVGFIMAPILCWIGIQGRFLVRSLQG